MAEDRTIQGVTMYCNVNNTYCGMAHENGYCKLSACANPKFNANIHPTDMIHSVGERSKAVHFKESRWRTGTPTEEGWYLLKVRHEDEIVYYANLLEKNTDLQWHYAMYGKIIAYKEIEP